MRGSGCGVRLGYASSASSGAPAARRALPCPLRPEACSRLGFGFGFGFGFGLGFGFGFGFGLGLGLGVRVRVRG